MFYPFCYDQVPQASWFTTVEITCVLVLEFGTPTTWMSARPHLLWGQWERIFHCFTLPVVTSILTFHGLLPDGFHMILSTQHSLCTSLPPLLTTLLQEMMKSIWILVSCRRKISTGRVSKTWVYLNQKPPIASKRRQTKNLSKWSLLSTGGSRITTNSQSEDGDKTHSSPT